MSSPRAPLLAHPAVEVIDLGRIPHAAGRDAMRAHTPPALQGRGALLYCEHDPVITVTRSTAASSLRSDEATLRAAGIDLVETDRGGDATFHGPGQLVGYPVLALSRAPGHIPLGDYMRSLERGLVAACGQLGVATAHTKDGLTGVWVDRSEAHTLRDAKLIAIGVGLSPKAVTRHGFAFNLDIDLGHYLAHLVPCGLADHDVTSLTALGLAQAREVVMSTVTAALFDQWHAHAPPSSIAPGHPAPDGAPHG